MFKNYKLSDNSSNKDFISKRIESNRDKLQTYIDNFNYQIGNSGYYAEEIARIVLGDFSLNNLLKSHPHVDIAVKKEIPNISKEGEVISIKSSITENNFFFSFK